jgi:hypothetical protein
VTAIETVRGNLQEAAASLLLLVSRNPHLNELPIMVEVDHGKVEVRIEHRHPDSVSVIRQVAGALDAPVDTAPFRSIRGERMLIHRVETVIDGIAWEMHAYSPAEGGEQS